MMEKFKTVDFEGAALTVKPLIGAIMVTAKEGGDFAQVAIEMPEARRLHAYLTEVLAVQETTP